MYQRGDRRIASVRKYCEWLEQQNPDTFNREKLVKLMEGTDAQAPLIGEEGEAGSSKPEIKTEDVEANEKKGDKSPPKLAPPPPLSIKAGSRTRKSLVGASSESQNTDEKGKGEAAKPVFMYRPPSSRIKQLPNAKPRQVVETPPVKTPTKTPPVSTVAAAVTPKQKQLPISVSNLNLAASPKLAPPIVVSSPTAQVRTYGPAKNTVGAVVSVVSAPVISQPTLMTTPSISTTTIGPSHALANAISSVLPNLPTSHQGGPTPVSVQLTPTGQGQHRHVLIARRNLAGPLMVASSAGVQQTVVAQKSQPIVIRNVTSNQLQQSAGTVGTTATVLQAPIQIPTSTVQLAVSGAGGAGGVAFLNLRGVPSSSVLRGVSGITNLSSISGSQVVRLLQQQGVQFIQQASPLQQSAVATSGNANLPVTVRLPVSSALQLNQNPTSAAMCSTASAIVAANTSAVRLAAARAGQAGTALQVVASRPLTGTNTVVARGTPIPASLVTTGNRMAKPTVTTVRTPGGTLRPASITGVRTTTLTASQLRTALSQGAIVRAAPGIQGTVVASGTPTGVTTVRTAGGTPVGANIRSITIPTTLTGVTSIARPTMQQGTTTASTLTASSMVRPLTISTPGARPIQAGVRGIIGNANTIWQQQIVTGATSTPPGTRLVTVPVPTSVRPTTASSLVAAAQGGIRIARRAPGPGAGGSPATFVVPIPRQGVSTSQVASIGSQIANSGGSMSIVTSSPVMVSSEGATPGIANVVVSNPLNSHLVQPPASTIVTLNQAGAVVTTTQSS